MNRINKAEIYKWFELFEGWKDKPLAEIRIVGRNLTASGYFSDPDSIIEWVSRYDNCNIYFVINSINAQCASRPQYGKVLERPSSTTTDTEIVKRDWVFLDIDVNRVKDTNATDSETEYAKEVARKVVRYLKEQGFKAPVIIFSGNGMHLYYRCDLLNTSAVGDGIKKFVEALGVLFDDERVKIDPVVFNASRIAKLPGTYSGKGRSDDKERPQRECRIISAPSEVELNDIDYFKKVASFIETPAKPDRLNDWGREQFDLRAFLSEHGIEVKKEVKTSTGTRFLLDHCIFDPNHKGRDAMIFQYDNGAIAYKCFHASCAQYTWKDVRLLFDPDAYTTKQDVADFTYKRRLQAGKPEARTAKPEDKEKGPIWLGLDEIPTLDPDSIESISTGIRGLDDRIFGGTIVQQLSVMTGRPGSGKSTLLNTILLMSVQQGFPTAIFSGELPNALLKSWITLPAAGSSHVERFFKRADSYFVPKEIEQQILQWLKGKLYVHNVEYGNDWVQIKSDIENIVGRGVRNVILDNLMTLNLNYEDEREKYKAQTAFIKDLHEMARDLNIHIWLVAHPRKQSTFLRYDDIAGASDIGNFADNIFIVHRVGQDFENQAKAFFSRDVIANITNSDYSNVIEIAKNRIPGRYVGNLVGVYYEPESKRMKNDRAEMFQFGWDTSPAPIADGVATEPHPDKHTNEYWYNKEDDNELPF